MTVRLIGYWKQSLGDEYPFPQEIEPNIPDSMRDRVASYLERGTLLRGFRGLAWCRFGCKAPNGSTELTRSEWAWPEGLAHYVRHHAIALPEEFLAEVTSPTPSAPTFRSGAKKNIPTRSGFVAADCPDVPVDTTFWVEWARPRRRPEALVRTKEALANATRRTDALLADAIVEAERTHGTGRDTCVRAGCERRAIIGMALCATCMTTLDQRERFATESHDREMSGLVAWARSLRA